MKKKKVLLFGPVLNKTSAEYGGGIGGYTRNMQQYLENFRSQEFVFVACFHSIREKAVAPSFLWRFLKDTFAFLKSVITVRPNIVHVLAIYSMAIPREFMIVVISKICRIPVIYEIKGGHFHTWYSRTNIVFRRMAQYCISRSNTILCEGQPYVEWLESEFGKKSIYFPNFVTAHEVPDTTPEILTEETLRILFVGYVVRDKGVPELMNGCIKASEKVPIELTFIGKEHQDFTNWLDRKSGGTRLTIKRLGPQPRGIVLDHYGRNDIYCYPTRHAGEGHNNSINEAMMYGLVIVTSRHGFLGSVLNPDVAYFIESVSAEEIASVLLRIANNRNEAKEKGRQARLRVLRHFTSEIAFKRLHETYRYL